MRDKREKLAGIRDQDPFPPPEPERGTTRSSPKDSHYLEKNKLEFKNHCLNNNYDQLTTQFSIVDVVQFKLQSILRNLDP